MLILLAALFVYFSVTQDRFLTSGNMDALITGSSILWMVAIGLTFVMLTGGFDLSLGSLLALSGIAMGTFMNEWGVPLGLGIVMTIAFGLLVGSLVNGVLIGWAQLPFLVVTLGTLTLYSGLVNLWSNQATQAVESDALTGLAFDHALGLPVPAWIMIARLPLRPLRPAQHLLRPRRLRGRRQRRSGAALRRPGDTDADRRLRDRRHARGPRRR